MLPLLPLRVLYQAENEQKEMVREMVHYNTGGCCFETLRTGIKSFDVLINFSCVVGLFGLFILS